MLRVGDAEPDSSRDRRGMRVGCGVVRVRDAVPCNFAQRLPSRPRTVLSCFAEEGCSALCAVIRSIFTCLHPRGTGEMRAATIKDHPYETLSPLFLTYPSEHATPELRRQLQLCTSVMFYHTVVTVLSFLAFTACGDYVSYPRPSIYEKSAHFSLKVNGTYMYTVSYNDYDYVQLSMTEGHPTEFRIAVTDEPAITSYSITPRQLNIDAQISGNELVFSLEEAYYLIIKINNEKEFVVMVDPWETDVPDPNGWGVYNVLDYGADNTGSSLTTAIQDAMDAAAAHPGSTVYVPPGLYVIGNLLVRDRTSLYLAGGSVLRFTANASDYKQLYVYSPLGPGTWWIQTEINSTDIKVYGRGTIDGNGYTSRQNGFIADLLVPTGTKNFICDGVLVRDSSFWAVTPIQVEDALLTNIKILDRLDLLNDDGIDVVESTRVTVRRAIAVAGDDSFSSKTWPYMVGTTVPYPYTPRPLHDVVFDNCLAWTNCYGYKIGQGVVEDQDGVTFQNSVVYTAGVGMGIDHKYGTMTAREITFENIDIEDLHGNSGSKATWLAVFVELDGEGVGPVQDILVRNIHVAEPGAWGAYLQGYNQSSMVTGVTLSDIYMYANITPATTLEQMDIVGTAYSWDIRIENSMDHRHWH